MPPPRQPTPAFTAPVPLRARSAQSRPKCRVGVCALRAARSDDNPRNDGEEPKRDAIAEWVARARSQRRPPVNGDRVPSQSDAPAHRAGAASALDAVDRLFGGAGSSAGKGKQQQKPERMGREQWLDAVRSARDNGGSDRRSDELDPNAAVDVRAVAPASSRRSARPRNGKRRRKKPQTSYSAADGATEQLGASDARRTARSKSQSGARGSQSGGSQSSGSQSGGPQSSGSQTGGSRTNGGAVNSSFARLIDIARRGRISNVTRNRRPDFETMADALADVNSGTEKRRGPREKAREGGRDGPRENSRTSTNAGSANSVVECLFDMTRTRTPRGFVEGGDGVGVDSDDDRAPRQRYITTRRVGGRQRRIREMPAEWAPMDDEDIAQLRSESAPLAPGRSIGADPVRDCSDCHGTGLEMCTVCVGTGWNEPLRFGGQRPSNVSDRVWGMRTAVWERPNLVVGLDGAAQCPYCVGIGKSLCPCCEGSGSALRKGFDPSEKYKVFDMFQGGEGTGSDDEPDIGDELDFSDDNDEHQEDADDYFIYTGEANGFGLSLPSLESSAMERVDDQDEHDIDGEQPFEILDGLHDDVDFRGKPKRRPMLKRVRNATRNATFVPTVLDHHNDDDDDDDDDDVETVDVLYVDRSRNLESEVDEHLETDSALQDEDEETELGATNELDEDELDGEDDSSNLDEDDELGEADIDEAEDSIAAVGADESLDDIDDGMVEAVMVEDGEEDIDDEDEDNEDDDEDEDDEDGMLSLDDELGDEDVDDDDDMEDVLPLFDEESDEQVVDTRSELR